MGYDTCSQAEPHRVSDSASKETTILVPWSEVAELKGKKSSFTYLLAMEAMLTVSLSGNFDKRGSFYEYSQLQSSNPWLNLDSAYYFFFFFKGRSLFFLIN